MGMQLAFELAWTLLGFRRYEECAEIFLDLIKVNSWWVVSRSFVVGSSVSTLAGVTLHTSSSLQVSLIEWNISERFGLILLRVLRVVWQVG